MKKNLFSTMTMASLLLASCGGSGETDQPNQAKDTERLYTKLTASNSVAENPTEAGQCPVSENMISGSAVATARSSFQGVISVGQGVHKDAIEKCPPGQGLPANKKGKFIKSFSFLKFERGLYRIYTLDYTVDWTQKWRYQAIHSDSIYNCKTRLKQSQGMTYEMKIGTESEFGWTFQNGGEVSASFIDKIIPVIKYEMTDIYDGSVGVSTTKTISITDNIEADPCTGTLKVIYQPVYDLEISVTGEAKPDIGFLPTQFDVSYSYKSTVYPENVNISSSCALVCGQKREGSGSSSSGSTNPSVPTTPRLGVSQR